MGVFVGERSDDAPCGQHRPGGKRRPGGPSAGAARPGGAAGVLGGGHPARHGDGPGHRPALRGPGGGPQERPCERDHVPPSGGGGTGGRRAPGGAAHGPAADPSAAGGGGGKSRGHGVPGRPGPVRTVRDGDLTGADGYFVGGAEAQRVTPRPEPPERLMKYLEGEEITEAELKAAIRKATINVEFFPVLAGSAFKNKGVQMMLDAVIDYLPSPLDIPAIKGVNPDTEEEETRPASDDEPFAALAFKIMTDPFVGRLTFFRVYSGVLNSGSYVLNTSKGKRERIGRILQMHANHRNEIETVYSGDIAAAVGLKDTTTGDSLTDEKAKIILESIEVPEPVIQLMVEPKSKADQDKMGIALQKLAEEDPTFRVETNVETGETVISGMGELHLDVLVDRMRREFKVEANVGAPQVSYRETFRAQTSARGLFKRQSGGKGQFGDVWIEFTPNEEGKGFEFENAIVGGVVPREFIPAVEKGLIESMANGVLAGYPIVDVKAKLYDGSYHDVDSSETAFKVAASLALKEAAKTAQPTILEPMMLVTITVPEENLGDVMGHVTARRGRVDGMEAHGNSQIVRAYVPLAEMFGYATVLRSASQGRGTFMMVFDHYEDVPKSVQEEIIKKNKGEA